jgi:hypothetical protein
VATTKQEQHMAAMAKNLRGITDDELTDFSYQEVHGQAATIEAMRRLRVAVAALTTESRTSARWMFRLTVVIAVLTALQTVFAISIILGWLS